MTQQWTARFSVTVSRCHGPSLAAGGHRQTASGRPHAESPTRDGAGRRNGRPAQIESRGTVPRALIPAAGSNEPRTRPHEQIAGRAEAPPLARAARAAGVTAAACDGDLSGARRSGSALALLPSPLLCVYVCVYACARQSPALEPATPARAHKEAAGRFEGEGAAARRSCGTAAAALARHRAAPHPGPWSPRPRAGAPANSPGLAGARGRRKFSLRLPRGGGNREILFAPTARARQPARVYFGTRGRTSAVRMKPTFGKCGSL